jgi:hypothetical protein
LFCMDLFLPFEAAVDRSRARILNARLRLSLISVMHRVTAMVKHPYRHCRIVQRPRFRHL